MTGSVMANAEGVNPSRQEVELQLERMLVHPLFKARAKQAAIFRFLVSNALSARKIDEKDIFQEFFTDKRYAESTTGVRTNVSHIRKELLGRYYKGDGKDDAVIIALPAPERSGRSRKNYKIVKRPPGEAYRPQFSYNPRAPIAKQFAIANHLMTGSTEQVERALWKFDEIDKAAPNHPDVVLGLAETVLCQILLGVWWKEAHSTLIDSLLAAIKSLKHADAWRVHNVQGALHTMKGDLAAAKKEFGIALRLDRSATIGRGWYTLFLVATGKEQEAAKLQGLSSEEDVTNARAQAVYGLYLAKAKRFDDAERVFEQSLALDRNCWSAHYGLAQAYLATGEQEKAAKYLKRLETLIEPADYQSILGRLTVVQQRGRER